MLFKKPSPVIGIVVGASFAAYHAGQNLHYMTPSPGQLIGIATAASTASVSAIVLTSPMTFAKIEPPPPVVPPNQKFEQG
jgi:hypothetical protein